jgi:hypothetical protein
MAVAAIARTARASTIVQPSERRKDPEPRERLRAGGWGHRSLQGLPLTKRLGGPQGPPFE